MATDALKHPPLNVSYNYNALILLYFTTQ